MEAQKSNGDGRLYDANMHAGTAASSLMTPDTLAAAKAYGAPVVIEFPAAHTIYTTGDSVSGIDEPTWYEAGVEPDALGEEDLAPFVDLRGNGRMSPTERAALDLETGDDLRAFLGRGARINGMLEAEGL